jgi:hypothetical protein
MPKNANTVDSGTLRVTLSSQSVELLNLLATRGIYGRNAAEVAARFVDERLRDFTEKPVLEVPRTK